MNYTQQQHGQKNRIKTSFCTVNYEIMLFVMIYNHFCFVIIFFLLFFRFNLLCCFFKKEINWI